MKKKFSKVLGVAIALVFAFSLVGVLPVAASPGITVTPAPGSGPISGELTFTVDYSGAEVPRLLEIDTTGIFMYYDYILGQGDPDDLGAHPGISFNLDADEDDPYDIWSEDQMELAREIGFIDATYDETAMEWTITVDTEKKCEVGDYMLMALGWWPGQEVYFDGLFTLEFKVSFEGEPEPTAESVELAYLFDNDEEITPSWG